jgi:hypothetical protein
MLFKQNNHRIIMSDASKFYMQLLCLPVSLDQRFRRSYIRIMYFRLISKPFVQNSSATDSFVAEI